VAAQYSAGLFAFDNVRCLAQCKAEWREGRLTLLEITIGPPYGFTLDDAATVGRMTLRRSLFALWAALAALWVGYVLARPVSYYDDFHALQDYVASSDHDPPDLDHDYTLRQHKEAMTAAIIRGNPSLRDSMRQNLMRNNAPSMEDNLYLWPYLRSTSPWAINRVVFASFPPVISLLAGLAFVWVWKRHGEAHWLKLPARLRRGSLRLYLVVAVPWVAWFGFQILINGPRWPYLTRAFWWLLLVPIGGPILALLTVWVVAGFKKAAFEPDHADQRATTTPTPTIRVAPERAERSLISDVRFYLPRGIMNCLKLFFSFSGRANRAKYWLGLAIAFWISILAMMSPRFASEATPAFRIVSILAFVYLLIVLATATKRLHDLDLSGWWAFGFFMAYCLTVFLGSPGICHSGIGAG
jgi:hypothetical protein